MSQKVSLNYVSEKCTSVEKPEPIQLTDAAGGSAVYFELPNKDGPLIRLTQACVIVVQSSPGHGLVLHPIALDLTQFSGSITIYQLHLSHADSHTIFDLNNSFNSSDDHVVESVPLNVLPGDNQTIVLFSFQPNSNQTNWNQLSFEFLVTSFIYAIDA
uniref:Uncharacterized protein n=1 Tax=Tetranychus urticae TaxID=32264 RepID=T1K3R0_TETUR